MIRERVLVVDDSPHNRMVATGHLEASGFDVVEAASGERALEILASQPIDLVVLDVLMPGLGGFETCRRIRSTPAMAEVPVLFLTALGDRETTTPALEAGGDDLLAKPFHHAELMLRVTALIRQRRLTAQLRDAMRETAAQNEQLRRVDQDRRRMNALIVHDIKSPLAAIVGNAGALRESDLTADQAEIIDDIATAALHIERTAHDLLDLARAEDGNLMPNIEAFALRELALEVVSGTRGLARMTDVAIELSVDATEVRADRELLRRLLQNLIHNAIKHAPARSAVELEARLDGNVLAIRVADAGRGVAPQDSERIFDHYVALDRGVRSHGLGLAFCRHAALAHGGRIWVEPRTPRGAVFCVHIPQPAAPP